MQVICLTENTCVRPALSAEHGLSLYIEALGKKLLFDMGQTELFANNAGLLGIDLSAIDAAILSHGHYDHGGGLKTFLETNGNANVYASKYAFEPHYNREGKDIGLDTQLQNNPRIIYTDDVYTIDRGLTLFTCNNMEKNFPVADSGMTYINNGQTIPEDFRHEQYLLIEENNKRILISGCSHKGIMDITHIFKPDVLIGGFHFSKLPLDDTLKSYAKTLGRYNTVYYTCHCTGKEQYDYMKPYIKNLNLISTGDSITIK